MQVAEKTCRHLAKNDEIWIRNYEEKAVKLLVDEIYPSVDVI